MRPPSPDAAFPKELTPLFAPVGTIDGVSKKLAGLFEKLAGTRIVDLLWHFPTGLVKRPLSPSLQAALGEKAKKPLEDSSPKKDSASKASSSVLATVLVTVTRHMPPPRRRLPYKVLCVDSEGVELTLVFFNATAPWLKKALQTEKVYLVSGRLDLFKNKLQMAHPDYMVQQQDGTVWDEEEIVYGLTAGLTSKQLLGVMKKVLANIPNLSEWHSAGTVQAQGWPSWKSAVQSLHQPQSLQELDFSNPARRRLAFDELLAHQLSLRIVRKKIRQYKGLAMAGTGNLQTAVLKKWPHTLTKAQSKAFAAISGDMKVCEHKVWLLQGDVGSGKSMVAFLALLQAVESGYQGCLMVPTEILAQQHLKVLRELCAGLSVTISLLTGRSKGKERAAVLRDLASGATDIVIGTHALFQKGVTLARLGLSVIDEQHRFGVHQRLSLKHKGYKADTLIMTATPIPRTLCLALYGDVKVVRLDEKPKHMRRVSTHVMPHTRLEDVLRRVRAVAREGARAYWVCPLVEETQTADMAAAMARHAFLQERLKVPVGLIHGRMKEQEKIAVMEDFRQGRCPVLVATTVIEVGVDVPEATIMIIEHAERFGLAQLHQLRGRVGRGPRASYCLLMYRDPLTDMARKRLHTLRAMNDGFALAEEDLRLRGSGDVLGTKQSGIPRFHVANLLHDVDLLQMAFNHAEEILRETSDFSTPQARPLRTLLYLFERHAAVRYLRLG